jgi:hypothetical protein
LLRERRVWAAHKKKAASFNIWIISLRAISSLRVISNLIPTSPVFLVSPEDPAICPKAPAPYFRQAPDRGLRFGAKEMVPQE